MLHLKQRDYCLNLSANPAIIRKIPPMVTIALPNGVGPELKSAPVMGNSSGVLTGGGMGNVEIGVAVSVGSGGGIVAVDVGTGTVGVNIGTSVSIGVTVGTSVSVGSGV